MVPVAKRAWRYAGVLLCAAVPCLSGQTWNLTGGGNWNVDGNWSASPFPDASGAAATLGNATTSSSTITLGQTITLGSLLIDDNNNYTVRNNQLVFDAGAGAAALTVTNANGNGAHTISSPIQLNSNLVITQGSSGALSLSGNRTGTGGLTKEGSRTLTLTGTSTYTGATAINNGQVNYNSTGALPAGAVTVGDGVGAADSAILVINASMGLNALSVSLASDGQLSVRNGFLGLLNSASGTGEIRMSSSSVEFMGNGAGNDSTFSGQVTGGLGSGAVPDPAAGSRLSKTGTSTLTLAGNNTYVARTFISGGALRAASATALGSNATISGTYVYSAGSLEISGSTTLSEVIALNGMGAGGNGALRSVSGNNTVAGPLTVGWSGTGVSSAATAIGVDAGSQLTISSSISGSADVTKVGDGLLRLSAAGGNTNSGATSVSGGTLALAASGGNAIAGTALTLNSGGTLLLEGANQINDAASLTLAGGNFSTGAGFNETLGTLTLSSDSAITLGAAIHNLQFGASNLLAWSPSATLTIYGWTGILESSGTAGRIYFGSDSTALSAAQLANITFGGYGGQAMLLPDGELVPMAVPEAHSVLAALLLAGILLWRERASLMGLLRVPAPACGPGR